MAEYRHIKIDLPDSDFDVTLRFPSGKEIQLQARPSNADVHTEGSFDIVFPHTTSVTLWEDDDMTPASRWRRDHIRAVKQCAMELW